MSQAPPAPIAGSHAKRQRRPRLLRFLPIARAGVRLVLSRRLFWVFLILALANFLFFSAMVYFLAELKAELARINRSVPKFVESFSFTGSGSSYRDFIFSQNIVVMLLLAFAGALVVGDDLRSRALVFYLSRPVTKLEYFLGKLAATATLAASVTLAPAILLFLEYGAFTESFDYFVDSRGILWGIVSYGGLVSVASSIVLLGVAALLERTLPILAVWVGLFVFLPAAGNMLRALGGRLAGGDPWGWGLLDFWSLLRWTSSSLFGIEKEAHPERLPWALGVLVAWMTLALVAFWRRIRAVEIVA